MDKKSKVKQDLQGKSIPEKLTYGNSVVGLMGADPVFGALAAEITAGQTATDDLETAKNNKDAAESALKTANDVQHNKEELYDKAFNKLGNSVDNIAQGDKTIIDKAGMASFTPGKASPIGELGQVLALVASEGDNPGEIDLSWDKLKGAASYTVQIATPNPSSFTFSGSVTKGKFTVTGLVSGSKYWFKVQGVGAAGAGPFSDPATKVCP